MLSPELAAELQHSGVTPKQLSNISFAEDSSLWRKDRHFHGFENKELAAKRYQYLKMGKIFGLQTKRYISQWQGHLFYFDNEDASSDYLGHCDLENVYIQDFHLKDNRHALVLSNCSDSSIFYFNSSNFWDQQQEEIVKYVVQLNFHEKYCMGHSLGQGSFAEVLKAKSKKTGEEVAAKIINKKDKKDSCTKKMATSQRKILHIMKGQTGISGFREFFQTQNSYVIVLDYVPGSTLMTLFNQQKQLCLSKLKPLFTSILTIMKNCHEKNIIHRDIKPHNIILTRDMEPKLIDFGLALMTTHEMESYNYFKCGTMGYTAPEVLLTDSMYYKSYGYKCDIFSFGVIAHMFLMGSNPLAGKSESERKKHINVELKEQEIINLYGEPCLAFLKNLMSANPRQRYTAAEALNSRFLRQDHEIHGHSQTRQSVCQGSKIL